MYVQNGKFFSEGGQEYTEEQKPAWLEIELQKVTPEYRKIVGLPEAPSKRR